MEDTDVVDWCTSMHVVLGAQRETIETGETGETRQGWGRDLLRVLAIRSSATGEAQQLVSS